jgi:UDP-N-acetylmuramyl pentapeptide phosphotransferase/UDP-N-acetylglucosamine-1-phosphate transferase
LAAGLLLWAPLVTGAAPTVQTWLLLACAACLGVIGAVDDIVSLAVAPRLLVQAAAAGLGVVVATRSWLAGVSDWQAAVMQATLAIGLIWMINLTNFMDGIDGITLAEFVPLFACLAILASFDHVPIETGIGSAAMAGALVGFAPFNKHVARLFLGDVGSLLIGFWAGIMLLETALAGQVAVAVCLPLYYITDATITLLRRFAAGEPVTQAHRRHFYQVATTLGWTVPRISRRILLTNCGLGLLALVSTDRPPLVQAACIVAAACLVAVLLHALSHRPRT